MVGHQGWGGSTMKWCLPSMLNTENNGQNLGVFVKEEEPECWGYPL